jgi:hypothetical protein
MYSSNIYEQPFWAENSGFMTGRDPLGIQNSSISVYARLLPGMTNLTLRLRYYGFYCWLLYEYDKAANPLEKRTLEHQYNYIRRAELVIAYIMMNIDLDEHSIVGSEYARNHIGQVNELGYYDIAGGADKFKTTPKGSVYWNYSSGALGQYYIGSLINLDLLEICDLFFHIKTRGSELAKCFKNSIDGQIQKLFLQVVERGKLTISETRGLIPFSVSSISPYSDEWVFYKKILLENDGNNFFTSEGNICDNRKKSIKQYLEYSNNRSSALAFDEHQYNLYKSGKNENITCLGWYYYFVNDAFHFTLESIFWAMLVELDGKIIAINEYIDQIVDLIIEQTSKDSTFCENKTIRDIILSFNRVDLVSELKHLEQLSKSQNNSHEAIGEAIRLMFRIYVLIQDKIDEISGFENLNYLKTQNGIISQYASKLITKFLDEEYKNYLKKIVKNILNDHISTAYRKMGNSEVSLLKFIIEDNRISHIQTMPPRRTNPRIRSLHNFLEDLKLIKDNDIISKEGAILVNEIA